MASWCVMCAFVQAWQITLSSSSTQCNHRQLSNHATWKLLKTSFDFPNCLLGSQITSAGVQKLQAQKLSCSVDGLLLNYCSIVFVSSCCRCRCLFGCCCESITCFFLYGHWWRYELPEGINSSLSFQQLISQQTIFSYWVTDCRQDCMLHSHTMVGLEYNSRPIVVIPISERHDEHFLA